MIQVPIDGVSLIEGSSQIFLHTVSQGANYLPICTGRGVHQPLRYRCHLLCISYTIENTYYLRSGSITDGRRKRRRRITTIPSGTNISIHP